MRYNVVCTIQEPWWKGRKGACIVALGTQSKDGVYNRWSVDEVRRAIKRGHKFYTRSGKTGSEARVVVNKCRNCGRRTLRAIGKGPQLDSLPRCGMKL